MLLHANTELENRETSDAYSGELLRLGDWRAVLCRGGIQVVLQRRRPGAVGPAGPRWEAVAFCATKSSLLRLWRQHTGDDGAAFLELPAVISRWKRQAAEVQR